jgi:hypothetical protein
MHRLGLLVAAVALATGCTVPTIYSWGDYENLVYMTYARPARASPETQVEKMEADLEKARAADKRVHPGFHAHLGYMYLQLGKVEEARREFQTEKAKFPESAVFMDRLLANLVKP